MDLMDHLHWQRFLAKLSMTASGDSHTKVMWLTTVLALATLGISTSNRNDPIFVAPPKVAKESISVSLSRVVVTSVIAPTFANVNTALGKLVKNVGQGKKYRLKDLQNLTPAKTNRNYNLKNEVSWRGKTLLLQLLDWALQQKLFKTFNNLWGRGALPRKWPGDFTLDYCS